MTPAPLALGLANRPGSGAPWPLRSLQCFRANAEDVDLFLVGGKSNPPQIDPVASRAATVAQRSRNKSDVAKFETALPQVASGAIIALNAGVGIGSNPAGVAVKSGTRLSGPASGLITAFSAIIRLIKEDCEPAAYDLSKYRSG